MERLMRMSLGTATALAAVMVAGPAYAADLRPPLKAPIAAPPPQYNWTACYGGGNSGLGTGQTQWSDPQPDGNIDANPGSAQTANTSMSGAVFGGQIGCDLQFGGNWVAGLAGSFDWSNISGTNMDQFNDTWSLQNQGKWYGTITGRVGSAYNNILLYAKGGVAFAHNQFEIENGGITLGTPSDTLTGWTAGTGLEWAFAPNWSAFLEADYYGFGSKSETFNQSPADIAIPPTINVKPSFATLTIGVNYRFGMAGWGRSPY
jgi:outer membrane immunogenic protein